MRKSCLTALFALLLAGCAPGADPAPASAAPEATPEATAEPEQTAETVSYDFSELKMIAPTGAPALSLLPVMKESENITTVSGPENLQAALAAPEPEYDVIIAPSNLGVKLAGAGKTDYRMLAVVTWGNLYLVGDSEDALAKEGKLALFGESAVGGLVFKSLYKEEDITPEITWYAAVTDAQAALLTDEANAALLAEPAATATIAKAKESGKELKIIADLQKEWGNGYPQAGLFVRAEAYEENKDLYDALVDTLAAYAGNVNTEDPAALTADLDAVGMETLGMPSSAIVSKVWDRMGVRIVRACEVEAELTEFLSLFDIGNVEAAILK